jgi:hypothetical protein
LGRKLKYLSPADLSLRKVERSLNPYRNLLNVPLIYHENGVAYTAEIKKKSNVFAQHLPSFSGFYYDPRRGTLV